MSGRLDAPERRSSPLAHTIRTEAQPGLDRFAGLVALVVTNPENAYNMDRYLWVLDEPGPRPCCSCGGWLWPGEAYNGGAARGVPRRYCSPRCPGRVAEVRCRQHGRAGEWGWAA